MYPPSLRTIYIFKQITLHTHLTCSDRFIYIIKKYKNVL